MLKLCSFKTFFCTPVFLALFLSASQASAERWYRVELLAFSQQGSELAETWPATPMLAYPDKGRFLMNQSEVSVTAEPIQETTD
ncbi:MAG: CsiV family protein, partial [Halioglobus sp.]